MPTNATRISISEVRTDFFKVERLLEQGASIEVTKRGRVIARIEPVFSDPRCRPDFLGRLRRIYGDRVLHPTGAELIVQDRERF